MELLSQKNVLHRRHVFKELEFLKNHTDPGAAHGAASWFLQEGKIDAECAHGAA
jgi:hypothetical protein